MNNRADEAKKVFMSLHGEHIESNDFLVPNSTRGQSRASSITPWIPCGTFASQSLPITGDLRYAVYMVLHLKDTGLLLISAYGLVLYRTLSYDARESIDLSERLYHRWCSYEHLR